jgi:hypothetical protein
MAQTRRMGKRNQRPDRPKAPRFSYLPNYVPFLAELAFLLFKLTRVVAARRQDQSVNLSSVICYHHRDALDYALFEPIDR